uniref:HAUS augmin-like complex subunit 6 N-terminal domain-containing protein n=1 Tax=Glossina morsitans morsitans TaxID=37546 RepID=A0A1B0G1C3_GLOMM
MDRSIIAPYRAEERELCTILYQKLLGLTSLYPGSEDVRKCLSDEMFLKVNQHAFFEIMSYLFRIFDAAEFKKRFFWPITDKKSEAVFRTSTVDYLKFINEKYQLNWSGIKSYLVVMPGGVKFIKFLLGFITFITSELIKQKEKHLCLTFDLIKQNMANADIGTLIKKDTFFKEYASAYIKTASEVNGILAKKSSLIHKQLSLLATETGCSVEILLSENFLQKFQANVQLLYEAKFSTTSSNVLKMQERILEAYQVFEQFHSKEIISKKNTECLYEQLPGEMPEFSLANAAKIDDEFNISDLISKYNCIHESIQLQLSHLHNVPYPTEAAANKLNGLEQELLQMESHLTDFQKKINYGKKKPSTPMHTNYNLTKPMESNLLPMFVCTPPIRLDVRDNCEKPRLSLFDAKGHCSNENFDSYIGPSRLAHQDDNLEDNFENCNKSFVSTSRIIDPVQLLKSINREPSKYKRVLQIDDHSFKIDLGHWKSSPHKGENASHGVDAMPEREESSENTALEIENIAKSLESSPYTPLNSKDCTRVDKLHFCESNSDGARNLAYFKKLSAIKKVQNASMNIDTSPSGRLEPLVTMDVVNPSLPKIVVNDVTLNDELKLHEESESTSTSTGGTLDNVNSPNSSLSEMDKTHPSLNEYDVNDILFNTSDSVLKDVSM